jgi:hypothetical protein
VSFLEGQRNQLQSDTEMQFGIKWQLWNQCNDERREVWGTMLLNIGTATNDDHKQGGVPQLATRDNRIDSLESLAASSSRRRER